MNKHETLILKYQVVCRIDTIKTFLELHTQLTFICLAEVIANPAMQILINKKKKSCWRHCYWRYLGNHERFSNLYCLPFFLLSVYYTCMCTAAWINNPNLRLIQTISVHELSHLWMFLSLHLFVICFYRF